MVLFLASYVTLGEFLTSLNSFICKMGGKTRMDYHMDKKKQREAIFAGSVKTLCMSVNYHHFLLIRLLKSCLIKGAF